MSNWNTIDIESVRRKQADENVEEKIKVLNEDEDGNITDDADDKKKNDVVVVADKEDKTSKTSDDKDSDEKKSTSNEEEDGKKSRAKTRIMGLVKENKELKSKYEQEVETLKARLAETNKESFTTQKEHLEARIKETKHSLMKAQEEGKFEEATEQMATLNELQTQKTVVDSYVRRAENEAKNQPKQTQKSDDLDDTEALAWSVRNKKWYNKDATMTTLANRLSHRLDKEGFDPSSREYFDELDERITDFTKDNKASSEDNNEDEDLQSSSKEEAKTKKPPQKSSGASRSSSSVTKLKDGTLAVRLSTREQAMAKKMGVSEKDWARRKARAEKAVDEHGYNMIFDN